jgi:hypothetical protein
MRRKTLIGGAKESKMLSLICTNFVLRRSFTTPFVISYQTQWLSQHQAESTPGEASKSAKLKQSRVSTTYPKTRGSGPMSEDDHRSRRSERLRGNGL